MGKLILQEPDLRPSGGRIDPISLGFRGLGFRL